MIDPRTCEPDQPFEGTFEGQRCVMMRNDPDDSGSPWAFFRGRDVPYARDDEVSGLVRLVPERPVTYADLPSRGEMSAYIAEYMESPFVASCAAIEAVKDHLNERGDVFPVRMVGGGPVSVTLTTRNPEDYRLINSADDTAWVIDSRGRWVRDENKTPPLTSLPDPSEVPPGEVWEIEAPEGQDGYWVAMRCDPDAECLSWIVLCGDGPQSLFRDGWRTDDEITLRHRLTPDTSGAEAPAPDDDPIVYAVRESHIAAVEVKRKVHGWSADDIVLFAGGLEANSVRESIPEDVQNIARYEALARAIEAEQQAAEDALRARRDEWAQVLYPEVGEYRILSSSMKRQVERAIAHAEAGDDQ